MHRDTDYIVKDGEVIIVDEFTGRLMYGRRFNDGLHQAIEAKEGVTVAAEQDAGHRHLPELLPHVQKAVRHDRYSLHRKADEFSEIYGLNIVSIPTNKPRARKDLPDSVYKTVNGKYNAVIQQVAECGTPRVSLSWSAPSASKRARRCQAAEKERHRAQRPEREAA